MKWIGQYIQDFIARFRNDVYLENIADGTVASDKFLGLDSNNKIVKETVTSGGGDITRVNATSPITGGGDTGDVTVAIQDASTSAKGAASFSDENFAVSSGAVAIKDGGVDLTSEVTGVLPVANQKHLMHYQYIGYSIGDGTNFEMAQNLTDGQAPFEHNDPSSSDGLTIPAGSVSNVSDLLRSGGHVISRAGTLTGWKGWTSCNDNSGNHFIGLFKWSPVEDNDSDITPDHGGLTMLVISEQVKTSTGNRNDRVRSLSKTSFTSASVSAGDIIFTQVKTANSSKTVYFNTTLEIEF